MPLCGAGCKLGWGKPVEARMGAPGVIIVFPSLEHSAGLCQAREDGLVQALVPEPCIECFDEGVLRGLSRCDVMPGNLERPAPFQDRHAGEFRAVIRNDGMGPAAAPGDDAIKLAGYAGAGDGSIGDKRQAFPAKVINDGEDTEAAAVCECIA